MHFNLQEHSQHFMFCLSKYLYSLTIQRLGLPNDRKPQTGLLFFLNNNLSCFKISVQSLFVYINKLTMQ